MKNNQLLAVYSSQDAIKELVGKISSSNSYKIQVKGVYGSSKSFTLASTIKGGVYVVVMDNKEEAQFFTNDLYNLLPEDSVFFFPSSSNLVSSKIATMKDSSQKVQRSAAISSLNSYFNGEGRLKKIILIGYPASVYEKIPNSKVLKKNIVDVLDAWIKIADLVDCKNEIEFVIKKREEILSFSPEKIFSSKQ